MLPIIKQITPQGYIKQALENAIAQETYILVRKIAAIAEKAVNLQRDLGEEYKGLSAKELAKKRRDPHKPNYIDDTTNLRQSIGYMIAVDGQPIVANLLNSAAQQLANSAVSGSPKGVVLILTAGMEYAKYVHRLGYDVLTTAELFCKKEFEKMLKKYKDKAK